MSLILYSKICVVVVVVVVKKKNQKTCNVFSAYLLHEAACHVVRCRAPTLIFEFLPSSKSVQRVDRLKGRCNRKMKLSLLLEQTVYRPKLITKSIVCVWRPVR